MSCKVWSLFVVSFKGNIKEKLNCTDCDAKITCMELDLLQLLFQLRAKFIIFGKPLEQKVLSYIERLRAKGFSSRYFTSSIWEDIFLLKMKGVLIDPLKPKYSQIFHFRSKGYGCWIWCSWNWYPLNGSWIDVDLINALIFVNLCCYQNVEYGVDVEHEFYQLVVVLSIGVADLTLVHRGTSTTAADCSVGGDESKTGGWEWGGRLGSTQPSLLHRSTSLVLVSGAGRVAWPACHLTGRAAWSNTLLIRCYTVVGPLCNN